jgi:predicted small secreted protein
MRKDTQSGITYRTAIVGVATWAVTAAVCSRLGGCGTIDGLGRDIQDSARIGKAALDRHLWGKDEGELELHTSIEE